MPTSRPRSTLAPLIRTPQEGAGEVLYGLGAAGGRQGDDLAALIYLRLSLYLAPENSSGDGDARPTPTARLKQNEQAIDVYQMVPAVEPAEGQCRNPDRARARLARAEPTRPSSICRRSSTSKPADLEALTTLGNLLRAQKRYGDAIEHYTKAIDATPPNDKAFGDCFTSEASPTSATSSGQKRRTTSSRPCRSIPTSRWC